MIYQLDNDLWFPDPHYGEPDGLFAIGGDLSIDRLIMAYSNGIFPWYSYRYCPQIMWYCPMQRFVIFPDRIHVSHSMRTLMRKDEYSITVNCDFKSVITACGSLRDMEEGAWLGPDMIEAYSNLHEMGLASSVEVWNNKTGKLAGGLYGVDIFPAFFGESMFSLEPSASKLALIFLAERMKEKGGKFIDCQFHTPHLESMGGEYIPYAQYMKLLNDVNI